MRLKNFNYKAFRLFGLKVLMLFFALSNVVFAEGLVNNSNSYEKAKVLEVISEEKNEFVSQAGIDGYNQKLKILILSGKDEGKTFTIENSYFEGNQYTIKLEEGNLITVFKENGTYLLNGLYRAHRIYYLAIIFLLSIIAVGKMKGLRSLVGLGSTVLLVFYVFLPMIKNGYDIMLVSTLVSALANVITIALVQGISAKSISAIIGSTAGCLCAYLFSFIFTWGISVTGISPDIAIGIDALGINLNLSELFFASVMLGTLGAVMDVSVSMSASIYEIHAANPELGKRELFKRGMNVGSDIMGTMTNTLILAYLGGSLSTIIYLYYASVDVFSLLNIDYVAGDILRSLCGSMALILAIPLTSIVASVLIGRKNGKRVI